MTVRLLSVPSLTENNISAVEEGFKLSEYLSCVVLCLSRKGNKLCHIAADIFQSIVSLLSTISHNRENIYLTVGEFLLYIGNKLLVLI